MFVLLKIDDLHVLKTNVEMGILLMKNAMTIIWTIKMDVLIHVRKSLDGNVSKISQTYQFAHQYVEMACILMVKKLVMMETQRMMMVVHQNVTLNLDINATLKIQIYVK